ncbi:hypothetical protein QJQ45_019009 [Haematococcus lacustris]|nr:hypothetical protein QJQ45_019009 [Haematococcus lacustris]
MQIVTKPRPRPPRPPISRFKLYTVSPLPLAPPAPTPTLEEGRPESASSASKAASKTPPRTPPTKPAKPVPKGKAKVEEEVEAPPPLNPQYTGASRWVVPAQGAVELVVLFQSPEVGTFTETLGFQVLGGERLVSVPCTGACDYPHISTDYRTVYYRKVKARPPSPSVSRQFIVSKGLFEFGPLLVGKDITGYDTGAHPANTAKFRITNNGLFDLTAEFQLQSQIAAREAAEDSKGKKGAKPTSAKPDAKGKGKAGPEQESVFMVAPLSLALKVDETQDVTVYAFPMEEGIVEDALVCTIKDNPEPVTFPLSVVGAKPVVHVRLDDGTPAPTHITAVPVPVAVELKPKTPPGKPGKAIAEQGPVNKILTEGVVFERLLLGRKDSKTFIITNPAPLLYVSGPVCRPGLLPIKWRLTGIEGLPKELVVSPVSGELEARSEAVVSVELSAIEKRDVTGKVVLEVLDQAELLGVAASIPIAIKGEAYRIERDLKFPQPSPQPASWPDSRQLVATSWCWLAGCMQEGLAGLDYGLVRVVDTKSLPLALKNTGKYPISYALTLRSALARELFTLQPEQGTVEPNKEATIQVVFNKAKELQRELSISSAPDITLAIIEPLTSNKEDIVPIRVSVRAVFSKYAITPARGVNFGPQAYNTTSKPRTFELVNTGQHLVGCAGEFPFNFRLFNFATPTTPVSGADKKAGKAATPPKKAAPQSQLVFGQFVAEPCEGVVAPGAKAEVSLVFKAEGARTYSEVLGIDVSERDVADSPGGISYEVGGESCIPGIDTSSLESIFEEHTISNCLDPAGAVPCQLGLRERAFNFGPITADLTVPAIVSHPPSASSVQGKKAAAPEPSSLDLTSPGGIKAALKFTNPIKIPCVVNFSIKPRAPAPDPKNPVMFPMVVQPAQLVIPPHESRFTTVHFRPHAIAQYSGLLEAVVEQGSDPQTKSFTCEIRGEGSLPSLSLQEPSVFDSHGRPLLKFPRVLLGLSAKLQVLLRNNGLLPASARMEAEHHSAFTITGGPEGLFTVQPGRSVAFGVSFSPQQLGVLSHEMRVKVNQNQYEDYRIAMSGEGYQEDVTFDHLPDGQLDELRLADCPVGTARQVVFCLHNHAAKHFKFRWPTNIPGLTFSPATGHLHAGASKDISLTFQAQAPVKLSPQPVKLALVAIDYLPTAPGLPPQPVNWDDRGVLATFSSTSSPTSASKPQQPAMQPEPEPSVKELAGSSKELVLKVYAVADNARYECSAPQSGIQFRPTMMFQTRAFAFTLTNTSTARLNFKFTVMTADGSQFDTSGLYSVTPEGGAIAAGGTASISVAFSPQEVDSCHRLLVCDIPGLDPGSTPLTRALTGKVLRPWCHFELVDSEYVSAGLRDPGLPGPSGEVEPLDPNTKVLEIESLGVRVRNTKRFMVLNPTAVGYNFAWEPHGEASSSSASPFRCVTTKGVIGPGRRFEMVFEFTPQADQLAEAFWTFRIPDQSITLPFLLVGHVSEPRITLDKPAISFGQCLVGGARGRGTVSLVNSESMPFSFTLDKSTYDATEQQQQLLGRKPVVEFTPFQGVIPAQSSLTLQALFAPQEERSYNYNVVCKVANKPTRLTLNVKGEGYALHDALVLEGAEGLSTPLAANAVNPLDFGQVIVNERSVRSLALVNTGSLAYDFVWDLGSNPRLSVKPITGTVGKGERVPVELAYHPHGPDKLRDYTVTCQIVNGGRYTLLLSGKGHKPRLDLSFLSHDFGARPLWQPGMSSASQTLRLTNRDTQPVAVDPQPLDTSGTPGSVWVVELPGCVLQSGASADGTISFRPEAEQHYTARLPLEINGLYTVAVELKGEGTPVRIEPVNPAHRAVNMGAVLKGQSSSRTVSLINRGRAAVHVHLGPSSSWLAQRSMQALPASPILLRPRETADVSLYYRPTERVRPWSESMTLDVDGAPLTVFTVSGSCHGTELTLASDVLPFGPVVLGSSASKRLALENTGDVGTKYSWDNKGLGPHFTIAPEEGFLAPGQTVRLDVTFRPQAVSPDIRVERVRCTVEGGSNLALTLTGACVTTVPQAEPVNFACAVRSSTTQTVNLSNPSSSPWQLRPVLSNDFFSGPEYVDVQAYSKAAYVITYRPLTMSSPDQPHEGSVFFPIPDGTGLLHRLVGRAEAPVPEGRIEKSITAKQQHTELLRVSNWLSRQQRFKVTIQRKAVDKATVLEGPEYIDVPAHSSKDYKLSVYSYTASVSQAVVTFKNESSGEYTFYELKLSASPAARQGELVLECPVRSSTAARVSVRNPLDSAVTLRGSTTSKLASVAASTVLAPNATSQVPVTFRPLLVGEQEAVLKLESTELGVYEWGLRLKGVPTIPEKVITFNVPLGGRETQVFKFRHLLDDKADYKISMASGTKTVFEAPAVVSAQAAAADGSGYECSVEVVFEPNAVSDTFRDTLVVSSPVGGVFECPLLGRCMAPKPQGPVDCSKGSATVPFKNVFATDAEFMYSVDNLAFVVKPSEKLGAKKATNIQVTFKPDPKQPGLPVRTAKLTVTCSSQTSVAWVFYLQA